MIVLLLDVHCHCSDCIASVAVVLCTFVAGISGMIGPVNFYRTLEDAVQSVQNDNLSSLTSSPMIDGAQLRRKKSSFFAAPVIASPLLRGLSRMKL